MATTTAALPVRATRSFRPIWAWYAVLVAFMVWGLAAWIDELHYGLAATGMRDVVSWGTYIFTFAFFIGLSAADEGMQRCSNSSPYHAFTIHDRMFNI